MAYKETTEFVSESGWNEHFRAIWQDVQSVEEAEEIMKENYDMFPVTHASYVLDGTTMTVEYTCDKCN